MDFEIASALTAMRTGIALAVGAIEARDDQKAKAAIAEVSSRLVDAQMDALRMSETLRKLDAELRDATAKLRAAEERLAEREKYVLRAVAKGVFVRSYEPVGDDPTPAHYQCQICFDRGESSILSLSDNGNLLQCRIEPKHTIRIASNVPHHFAQRSFGHWD